MTREELEARCSTLGRNLAYSLPSGVGFVLIMADFGIEGSMAYLSNAQRQHTIKMLREMADKMEGGHL